MDITLSQRRAAISRVDDELREAVLSDETGESVTQIASKNSVPGTKLGELSEEVANVLLGLRNPSDFIPTLQRRLGVSPAIAQAVANDINTQVFRPVRIPLLKMFGLAENGKPQQTATATPVAPSAAFTTPAIPTAPTPTPAPVITPKPVPTPTATVPQPAQPIRIPVIVPPPGIGENKQPAAVSNVVNRPQSPQQSQFVQYQPLKQNPFEMKPMPSTAPVPVAQAPLNPNTLNASAPQVHTLKEDIKNMTIVQQKLQNVVSAPKKTIEWTKPEIKIGSTGTYTVDPYREPPQP